MHPRRTRFPSRSALLGLWLVAGLAGGLSAAQERPNFTGDWTLDLTASQLHEDFRALERGTVRIDHREPAFTFRRTYVVKGKPFDASFEVTTDGREHRSAGPRGEPTVATMRWEQAALVVQQRISDPRAGELTNKVRYELIDNGRTLRATEDFDGAGRTHHNVWIFRQTRPDFSGTWLLTTSDAPAAQAGVTPTVVVLTQTASSLTLKNGDQTLVFPLDGSETTIKMQGPGAAQDLRIRTRWDGARLVVEQLTATTSIATTVSLSDDGSALTVEMVAKGPQGEGREKQLFKRSQ
jgi:hypothetical protein